MPIINSGDKKFNVFPKIPKPISDTDKQYIERKRNEWMARESEYYEFAEHSYVAYDLKRGEIYEVDWGMNVNAEFSGRHYGVVLVDSPAYNPLVLMCPLKTNHKQKINANSDYYVGEIKGLPINVKTVAVLNQARTLDKMRIYTQLAIGPERANYKEDEFLGKEPTIIRLEDYKLNKIVSGVARLSFGLMPFDDQYANGGAKR